ncbi:MAG: hypothetical protein BWY44_00383 [Candidatus Omnitrophica bacterium ADurb.Bin292]|jgi:hypothetical protein|nr:MAG: hypothetical protein BWY44_00383 [Candidatus Omnitrophica bacterium ADurb.Bin292]HPW76874.1 hypothetical protein [Candidatus Omnitrophota bacterium]HQB11920.1 hypothetical protein [Candidatus Omnitrophota bacterium]
MKKISLIGLILVTAFFNAAMARSGQYDEDARAQEKTQKQFTQEARAPEKRTPLKTIGSGIKEITYDNVRDVTKDTTQGAVSKTPVIGTLDGTQQAGEKVVDNTIRGVKKVASFGLAKDDSYTIEEAEKGSGDAAKIKLFQF